MQKKEIPVRKFLLPGLLMLLALQACGGQTAVPEDRFYRLQVRGPEQPFKSPTLDGVLEVSRLGGGGLMAGRPIVYSTTERPNELKEYHYQFWTETPTILVTDQLIGYLRAARVADSVVPPELRANPQYVLSGKIQRLEKISGAQPGASLELELGLRQIRPHRILVLDTYRARARAADDSVGAAVAAINAALFDIFAQFVADIPPR
jgi:ABC-type uncharacterized transport system auxiliary subunit